jgi:phage-related protein
MTGTDGYGCSWRFFDGVRDAIKDLGAEGAALLSTAASRYSKGTALPRHVKNLGDGILEIRVSAGTNHYRLLFFHPLPHIAVGLVAFYKNSNKTPPRHLALARERKRLWERAG